VSFELLEPTTMDEALAVLACGDPAVRPIGGGTALMLMMKAQLFSPARLVSLRRLGAGLRTLSIQDDELRVGAMITLSELEHSELVRRHFPVIETTMLTLANVRVRNVATVGGNLAHADPHLDLPPVWMALGATAELTAQSGSRSMSLEELLLGYYETALADGELITGLRVPLRPSWRCGYTKVTTRAVHDWPALGLSIALQFSEERLNDLRIVLSAATDRPTRLRATESRLRDGAGTAQDIAEAAELAAEEVPIESDSRGSAGFKRHLLRIHFGRALCGLLKEFRNE
jgi:carbon-monoxide dehydrogenase medium subunit